MHTVDSCPSKYHFEFPFCFALWFGTNDLNFKWSQNSNNDNSDKCAYTLQLG